MNWQYKIKLKDLFTESEDHTDLQESMNLIADRIRKHPAFAGFNVRLFRNLPPGNEFFTCVEYANKLIERMFDYADEHRIWVE